MTRIIDLDSHPTVLDLILHHLDLEPEQRIRRAGLIAMMQVSRGLHAQAGRVLYRSVHLEDGDRERQFWDSIASDNGQDTAIASHAGARRHVRTMHTMANACGTSSHR